MYAIGKEITDQITKENFEAVFVVVVVVNACILDSKAHRTSMQQCHAAAASSDGHWDA